jgi:multiphosphoryl transfer protein
MADTACILQAPLTGWALPLAEVPDPVFAQGMAGAGSAIDPTESRLYAPCSGEIVGFHRCLHALTMRTDAGVEILMHVGIDTVQLQGAGFTPLVKAGDKVAAGTPLLDFDSDLIARKCRSLVTVVLVPGSDSVRDLHVGAGTVQHGDDWMRFVIEGSPAPVPSAASGAEVTGRWLELPNPAGMHARPAARLLALARELPGTLWVESERERVQARSLVAVLGLGLGRGDKLRLVAAGLPAEQLKRLEDEILLGLGDDLSAPIPNGSAPAPVAAASVAGELRGVLAAPGVALGEAYLWRRASFELPHTSLGAEAERKQWLAARSQAQLEIEALQRQAPVHQAGIFAAHNEILHDPELLQAVDKAVEAGGSAAGAWHQAYEAQAVRLEALPNPLLAARANDLRDVGERVLRCLLGAESAQRDFPPDCVVLARDLNPSDTLQLNPQRVRGLCLAQGGPTSHVAILARSLGIPSLCAVGEDCLDVPAGTQVILDADAGLLYTAPTPEQLSAARGRLEVLQAQRVRDREQAHHAAATVDGRAVEVAVNIANLEDLQAGLETGAEGVGLFRTEFYFHELSAEPTAEQQREMYGALARALGPQRRLVARLLDVGGDKPLAYLNMPAEENPFLGVRGIRLFARQPDLFRRQIEALMSVHEECRLAIMVPMVASLSEWRAIRAELDRLAAGRQVEVGLMIEVPSAALLADQLAPEVDFFSIGTNDLTQYTLAIDRGHPDLAGQVDPLHPAILQLMHWVGAAAARHNKWVGVCGGAASDPDAVPLLLGMNVTELSVSAPAVPAVKAEVRRWRLSECQMLVEQALGMAEATQVRQLVRARRA